MSTRQIFNEQGFLTADGKTFVNEGFTKEVKKIFGTACSAADVMTINCILKSIVGEASATRTLALRPPPLPPKKPTTTTETTKASLTLIKSDHNAKVIPFPGNRALREMSALLTCLSDVPLMDVE
jgi:hypothetical protein